MTMSTADEGERSHAYRSEEWLREKYWGEGKSLPDIADETGVSDVTIFRWMRRLGVETRSVADTAGGPCIPDEELRQDVERVAGALGRRPSTYEYNEHGEYSHWPVCTRWGMGSWTRAMDELGI